MGRLKLWKKNGQAVELTGILFYNRNIRGCVQNNEKEIGL